MSDGQASRKPEDSDFQQQRLKAWQPLLTPQWVIATFIFIVVVFIPIGVAIVIYSDKVVEIEQRYDNVGFGADMQWPSSCLVNSSETCTGDAMTCQLKNVGYDSNYDASPIPQQISDCSYQLNITITEDMKAPVYVYYKLTNFYQNHRRYVKSRSDSQLAGERNPDTSTCDPLETDEDGRPYYPCGLIAGSFFIDRFSAKLYRPGSSGSYQVSQLGNWSHSTSTWQKDGIAWATDKNDKFKSLPDKYADTVTYNQEGLLGVRLPPVDDEDFIVWMRTAGLPTFKKLYRKINKDLKAGDIVGVDVFNYYPVHQFSGEKYIVLSTTSWLGGKNSFLGWAYIVVGIVCGVLALAFGIKHLVSPRPLGDMKYFNWPGAQSASSRSAHH